MSTVLRDTLERMNAALGFSQEDYHCAVAKSMLVSCDNAHALHPNRPEVADAENRPVLGGGHGGQGGREPKILHRRVFACRVPFGMRGGRRARANVRQPKRYGGRLHSGQLVEHSGEHAWR